MTEIQQFLNSHSVQVTTSIIIWVLTSLYNALSSYPGPDANVVETWLHDVMYFISFTQKWSQEKYLKMPFSIQDHPLLTPAAPKKAA